MGDPAAVETYTKGRRYAGLFFGGRTRGASGWPMLAGGTAGGAATWTPKGVAMLNVNPQTVCFVIARAKEFQSDGTPFGPDEVSLENSEWLDETLQEYASEDTSYQEVKAIIDDLDPDQQVTLIALMWLGRGDYDVEDWDSAYADAADSLSPQTAEYLMATPLVADYLEEGLTLLGYSCED